MPRRTQVKKCGLIITVERRGISSGIALRHLSCPWLHVWSAKDHAGGETALWGIGPRGQTLRTIRTEGAQGPHTTPHPNRPWGTLGINNCGGPISQFSFGHWGSFLLSKAPGLLSFPFTTAMGLSGQAKCYYSSHTLSCNWDSVLFSRVSNRASLPHPFWGGICWTRSRPLFSYIWGTCSFNWTKCKL